MYGSHCFEGVRAGGGLSGWKGDGGVGVQPNRHAHSLLWVVLSLALEFFHGSLRKSGRAAPATQQTELTLCSNSPLLSKSVPALYLMKFSSCFLSFFLQMFNAFCFIRLIFLLSCEFDSSPPRVLISVMCPPQTPPPPQDPTGPSSRTCWRTCETLRICPPCSPPSHPPRGRVSPDSTSKKWTVPTKVAPPTGRNVVLPCAQAC